jgi:hypothetical protein
LKTDNHIFGKPIELVAEYLDAEIEYVFNTKNGKVRVNPSDILRALKALSESSVNEAEILPPEEDLTGWDIINATDEEGKSHPFFLMRTLPTSPNFNYSRYKSDDDNMVNRLLQDIYKVTPIKIKWIKFKSWVRSMINRYYRRGKK